MDMAWPVGRRSLHSGFTVFLGGTRTRASLFGGRRGAACLRGRRVGWGSKVQQERGLGRLGLVESNIANLLRLQQHQQYRTLSNDTKSAALKPSSNDPRTEDTPSSQPLTKPLTSTLAALRPRHENIYNLPNFLTLTRLLAAPTTSYLLLHNHPTAALALFAYAGITDLLDGYLARKWKLQTVAGSVLDPGADKTLMIILTVTLAVKGLLPLYLAALILGRDVVLAGAAGYYRYASLPAPKTVTRYWDFSIPSAEVHPTTVSKFNTFLQLILIGSTLAMPVVTAGGAYAGILGVTDGSLANAMTGLQVVVAGTTVWSGFSYAILKDAVTILGKDEELKRRQGRVGRGIIGVSFGVVVAVSGWLALREDEVVAEVKGEVD